MDLGDLFEKFLGIGIVGGCYIAGLLGCDFGDEMW